MNGSGNVIQVAVVSTALATAASAPASATECGTGDRIRIAEMTWLSASTPACISQRILAVGYGCNAELVPGDTVPTATSLLSKNGPDIGPELCVSTAQSIWDRMMAKGNVYRASDILGSGGGEGWWISNFVAAEHPQIRSIEVRKASWEIFEDVSSPGKGRLCGCPPGPRSSPPTCSPRSGWRRPWNCSHRDPARTGTRP